MANTYVNKVVQSNGTTLIDITDTTAVASDVASGKYFYLATGEKVQGTAPSQTLIQKTITLNATYDPQDDNADGYSEVTVNVQNGVSVTEVQNAYGTELRITSAPGAGPSATQHSLNLGLSDESTVSIPVYYDNSLIETMLSAYAPSTWSYSGETVYTAAIDNGEPFYDKTPEPTPPEPSGDWTTVYDGSITINNREFSISSLTFTFNTGETYRVTIGGSSYTMPVQYSQDFDTNYIGNLAIITEMASTGDPVVLYNIAGYIMGNSYLTGTQTLKLERQTSGGT